MQIASLKDGVSLLPSEVRTSATSRDALEQVMLEPGDGRVTKPSLLARETVDPTAPQNEDSFLPIAYYFFLCEAHDQLTGNVNFQDNLLSVLLTRDLPWEQPQSSGMQESTNPPPAPANAVLPPH